MRNKRKKNGSYIILHQKFSQVFKIRINQMRFLKRIKVQAEPNKNQTVKIYYKELRKRSGIFTCQFFRGKRQKLKGTAGDVSSRAHFVKGFLLVSISFT